MKKLKLALLLILSITLNCKNFAQNRVIVDSLKQEIANAKHDTILINAYIDIGYLYEHILPSNKCYSGLFNLSHIRYPISNQKENFKESINFFIKYLCRSITRYCIYGFFT